MAEPKLTEDPSVSEQLADLKATLLREAETYRLVLHTLSNAVNAMSLKMEVILAHIRRRGE